MKKFLSSFLVLSLVFSIFAVSSPEKAQAATNFCSSGYYNQSVSGITKVINGDKSRGACHIQYYHMAAPGKGSVKVDGVSKSQLSAAFDRATMASIADEIIGLANGGTYTNDGKYKAEFFSIRLNQYIRVIYYKDNDPSTNITYNNVITMYPYK
ncbi:hypothetical protein VO178_18375 [Lysinibacillus fusiformis]|uniref:hypothetical protein n=1 Tax=Lysinibacillus fusiformis TaxID=28031 RepID=UPI002D77916E|nr:hypothetical protein [Lysinibacillus fusiformis]WRS97321.1 hypothetical protein VO178_18375 [Lysinibacillus fusiformis]